MLNKIKELRRECQYYLKFSVKIKKLRKKMKEYMFVLGRQFMGIWETKHWGIAG